MVKREKQEARKTLDNRIQPGKQLEQLLVRVEAQLLTLANSLDAALADVIRLQAIGATQAEKQTAPVFSRFATRRRSSRALRPKPPKWPESAS